MPGKVFDPAEARVDFIRRLFAVTVSVGFASQLSRLLPDPKIEGHALRLLPIIRADWRDLLLEVVSLIVVIASWEGYLRAVHERPLRDLTRFCLDVVIVFTYLLLLLMTHFYAAWFWVLTSVFVLYAPWDWWTPAETSTEAGAKPRDGLGQAITWFWLAFFIVLTILKDVKPEAGFLAAVLAALFGVVMYRVDKARSLEAARTWTWTRRMVVAALPLIPVVVLRLARRH